MTGHVPTVEVPVDRLVALRTMAWAGMQLKAALKRREKDEYLLDDDEREVGGLYFIEHDTVEQAREAMNGLQFGGDLWEGYETLTIGPTLDEFAAMQREER